MLEQVKTETQEKVQAAKREIEHSVVAARTQIEGMSDELSAQIMKAVLPAGVAGSEASQ